MHHKDNVKKLILEALFYIAIYGASSYIVKTILQHVFLIFHVFQFDVFSIF